MFGVIAFTWALSIAIAAAWRRRTVERNREAQELERRRRDRLFISGEIDA